MVNSRPGLVTATPFCEGAPLLPKLRGYFAEFLREVSLARLRLFDEPTCVRYAVRSPMGTLWSVSREQSIAQSAWAEAFHYSHAFLHSYQDDQYLTRANFLRSSRA